MERHPWSKLIDTWFGETLDDTGAIPARMAWWFGPDPKRDTMLGEQFSPLLDDCAAGLNFRWIDHPEGRLAMIITLDQLPRNLFRGQARAFAHDAYTAALCLAAAASGEDRKLTPIQRAFLYMPLQHFEDLAAQQAGVELYQGLANDTPDLPFFREGFLPYAEQHRDIIARFGRFPHRNQTLERVDTPEESAYLAAGAPRFGQ